MTIASSIGRIQYNGNGTTQAFTVPFYFLANSHLQVVLTSVASVDTVQTITTNYTVSGSGNPAGGTVTMVVAPASGEKLTIIRSVPLTQSTDLVDNDPLPAEALETALDKGIMIDQQIQEQLDRTIKVPVGAGSGTLPAPQANTLIGWNGTATGLQNYSPASQVTESSNVNFLQAGTGAVARTVQDKLREIEISVTDFGAVGDWNGSSGTDNLPAFNAAITRLKLLGGGTLHIPAASGGYWLNGIWDLDDCRAITIKMPGRPANLDVESLSGTRLVFTSASHCVRFDRCEHVNLDGVVIDCNNAANNGVLVRRLYNSEWRRVIVYRNIAAGFRFEGDPIGLNPDAGNVGNTFIEMACRGVRGMELVGATGGSWHNTYINTRIDYTGAEGLRLEQCDNCTFIETFFFRRSGVGPGVRWAYPGSGLGPNSIFFYHLQGEIAIDANVLYPGAVYGFDQSNGQAWPTIPNNIEFAITSNGLNARGWMTQKNAATRSINVSGANVGWAWEDNLNLGHMLWNNTNGNAFTYRLNSTSRYVEFYVDPDGTGDQLGMELSVGGPRIPTGKRINFIDSQTTVGAAGGASALPATPSGYLLIQVNGTNFKVPYYAS